jgi:three-Cys-motif partner protein
MATGDLVIGSDGELTLVVGQWAREKLHYIDRYCHIFNMGMRKRWAVRTYIDLFAGPGRCQIQKTRKEISGSPFLALSCEVPFTHYFFNDLQPSVINALKARAKLFSSANMVFFNRDCNLVVDELLQKLPSNSLDFCFVDPFNWEIKFHSIQKLTEKRRMDLAITFHIGSIKRVADKPPKELIDFFPDTSWQQEYEKAGEEGKLSGRVLLDAYERGLSNLGYKEIKDYVLMANKTNVPLYNLIFASKHPRGADFWDKIAERSETGQLRMVRVIQDS